MQREHYIAGLRALADFYEANPEIRIYEVAADRPHIEMDYFNSTEEQFLAAAKALGTFEKTYSEANIWISRELAPGFILRFEARRNQFCTKVTKVIPAHTVEVPEQTVEEWDCDSLVAKIKAIMERQPSEDTAA